MVLVVDDTKNIRNLLTTYLEACGYEVLTAANGQEAIEIAKKYTTKIELIFLDIKMPEMNGTEVLKGIRNMGMNCPVIIMTAFATIKNAVDCTKLGAIAYLQKPFTTERVKNILNDIWEENRKEASNSVEEETNAYLLKGKDLLEKGQLDAALGNFKTALSVEPSNWEVYFFIGKAYEGLNDIEEANKFYTAAKVFAKEGELL